MGDGNYFSHLLQNLNLFQRDDFLCDTIINIGKKSVRAHGIVLAAASPFFRAALETSNETGLRLINLLGCDFHILETAVRFMYTGKLEVGTQYAEPDKLAELFESLRELGLNLNYLHDCEIVISNKEDLENEHDCDKDGKEHEELVRSSLPGSEYEETFLTDETQVDQHPSKEEADGVGTCSKSDYSHIEKCKDDKVLENCVSYACETAVVDGLEDTGAVAVNSTGDLDEDVSTNGWILTGDNGIHVLEIPLNMLEENQAQNYGSIKLEAVNEIPAGNHALQKRVRSKSAKRVFGKRNNSTVEGLTADFLEGSAAVKVELTDEHVVETENEVDDDDLADLEVEQKPATQKRKSFMCTTCGKIFGKADHLSLHLRVHTGEKPYSCDVCGKKFSLINNLNRHTRSHTGEKRFLCHFCGRGFIQKTTLVDHLAVHSKDKKHTCNVCGKSFKSTSCLRTHNKRHRVDIIKAKTKGAEGATEMSDEIKKLCKDMELVVMDDGITRFVCKICQKDYASKNCLAAHIKLHFSEKRHSCSYCEKSFSQRAHLQIHERSHTGEKPLSCSVCGKSFAYTGGLNTHMRVHTGEKPYSCNFCGSTYSQQAHLTSHLRTHTGEKPFECKACGKRYRNKVDLRLHFRRNPSCGEIENGR